MTEDRRAELKETISKMRAASRTFYGQAIRCGNHAFIEFTGLMNDYIRCCEDALERGIDFTECDGHTGQHLPIATYRAEYLSEKLNCIYGQTAKVAPNV